MKVIVVKRKTLVIGTLAVFIAAGIIFAAVSMIPAATEAMAQKKEVPIYSVDRSNKVASLTFDAAWGNEDTGTLISILNKYHIHATFFIVGMWADKYPESVKQLADAGEDVMNHSDNHPHMPGLSSDKMAEQINSCDEKIKKITGKRPVLFRPPYGDYSNAVVDTARTTGHYCIQWSVDSLDWKGIEAPEIQRRVLTKVKPGSIILFHNAAKHTPEALPGIIESLQKQGYKLVPVSKLIYKKNFTIDAAGRQHKNGDTSPRESSNVSSGSSAASVPQNSGCQNDSCPSENLSGPNDFPLQ